jgi:uncharacterized membrane protein
MAAILTNLRNAVMAGFILAAVIVLLYLTLWDGVLDTIFWQFATRWAHVLTGIMWIGLLWYFNFVQIPTMPSIPDEMKPAIGKHIAPKALFWFRWAALFTVVTGLLLAWLNGYIGHALSLGATSGLAGHTAIGLGMWLALIMAFNVWFVIWPNQKKALNIANQYADLAADAKAKAARTAMLFSRTNTVLSVPMLFCMVAAQGLFRLS